MGAPMITLKSLDLESGLRHAFFTRAGGVSDGLYRSLNCGFGSGDAPENVAENRRRAMAMFELPDVNLVTCYQDHTLRALRVDRPWAPDQAPVADAMVTTIPGIALGVLSADCTPLLLADGVARVIGAAHAGWRGALGGVVEAALDLMIKGGARPENIVAAVGPCIGRASYEVSAAFADPFLALEQDDANYFEAGARKGHLMFDPCLSGYHPHPLYVVCTHFPE